MVSLCFIVSLLKSHSGFMLMYYSHQHYLLLPNRTVAWKPKVPPPQELELMYRVRSAGEWLESNFNSTAFQLRRTLESESALTDILSV